MNDLVLCDLSSNSVGLREMNNLSPVCSLYGKRLTSSHIQHPEAPGYECHAGGFLLSRALRCPSLLSLWYLEQSRLQLALPGLLRLWISAVPYLGTQVAIEESFFFIQKKCFISPHLFTNVSWEVFQCPCLSDVTHSSQQIIIIHCSR